MNSSDQISYIEFILELEWDGLRVADDQQIIRNKLWINWTRRSTVTPEEVVFRLVRAVPFSTDIFFIQRTCLRTPVVQEFTERFVDRHLSLLIPLGREDH